MSARKSAFRTTLIFVLGIVLMVGLTMNSAFATEQETVVFVHTNDVHGHFEIEPYVKAVADIYKEQYGGENVLTVSAGDVFAGGEPVAHMTAGESTVEIMNAAGYDALAVGNNDIPDPSDGSDRLAQLLKHDQDTDFPILCANMVYSAAAGDLGEEGELPLAPYTIFTTASGVKIGMFGLTTTGSPPIGDDASFKKLDSIETARKYVDILKHEEQVDIVVALGHTGWPDNDPTMTATTATDYNSYQISMAVDGIDLFIDGHTHSVIGENGEGYVCENDSKTLIVQTGCFGDNIGVVTMSIDPNSKTISAKSAEQITRTDYEANYTPDAETLAIVEKWTDEINTKLSAVVGHTDYFLNGERTGSEDGMGIRLAEQNLGNLVTDAIRDSAGADVAFFSGVRIRASLDAGDITVKGLHGVFANGGTVVKGEMTGAEIKNKLASSVSSAAGGKESPGFAQVSGICFVYDTNGTILSVTLESDGSELEDDKTYVVAGEMGGESVSNSITLYDGEDELVDMFIAYLASDMYDNSKYAGKLGRITRVETAVYDDIAESDEAYEAAIYLQQNGIMVGVGDKRFAPDLELTRAMAVTVLYRIAGEPEASKDAEFTDVDHDQWYSDAVAWAAENGIAIGVEGNRFEPDRSITDVELSILLARFEDLQDAESTEENNSDSKGGSHGGQNRITELTVEDAAKMLSEAQAAEQSGDKDTAKSNYKTLAEIYQTGSDKDGYVTKDLSQALEYFLKAGEFGDSLSYVNAGDIVLANGDKEKAVEYYEKGSEGGNPKGYRNIGTMYENDGDYIKALEYYNKALELNDVSSCSYIGRLYDEGKLGDADLEKAAEYYLKAYATNNFGAGGVNYALYRLGCFYENGLGGFEKNIGRAVMMYTLASQNGNEDAGKALDAVYQSSKVIKRDTFAQTIYSELLRNR